MGGVGRDITTLVVTMKGKVKSEEINKTLFLLLAHHEGIVVGPILGEINLTRKRATAAVSVLVDFGSNLGKLGNEIKRIVKGVLPVLGLVDAALVGLCEFGVVVENRDSHGKLSHGMKGRRQAIQKLDSVVRKLSVLSKLARQLAGLLYGRDFSGKKKPKHGLRKHLTAILSLGKNFLALSDSLAVEANTLVSIKNGTLPEHSLKTTHTAQEVLDLDITERLLAKLGLDLLEELDLSRDDLSESFFESGNTTALDSGPGRGVNNADRFRSQLEHCNCVECAVVWVEV